MNNVALIQILLFYISFCCIVVASSPWWGDWIDDFLIDRKIRQMNETDQFNEAFNPTT